ncbi:hypothetical protein MCERE85_00513 [Candidatus Nanopelagicaceae bacterium]
MTIQELSRVGRFNARGIAAFASLLKSPLLDVISNAPNLIMDKDLFDSVSGKTEIRPVNSRLELGQLLFEMFDKNPSLRNLQSDQGLWSWMAAAWLPTLFENSPRSAKIGEQARWILDKQKTRYYRHLLAGPYFIYNQHYPTPDRALSILAGSPIIPGELVGQIAATSDIAYSVGAEVATILYIDSKTGKPKKGSGGAGPGSPRRLTAAYLNQIDLTLDYRGMNAIEVLNILPEEFNKFKN